MPDPESPEKQIQKDFSETAARARKFVFSSAIILIILIVVVGQELREYRTKQRRLVKQIQTTAKNEQGALARLEKEHLCIRCELIKNVDENGPGRFQLCDRKTVPGEKSISAKARVKILDVPTGTRSVHSQRDLEALVADQRKVGELVKTVKDQLPKENAKQKTPPNRPPPRSSEFGSYYNSDPPLAALKNYQAFLDSTRVETSRQFRVNLDTCEVTDSDQNQPLSGLLAHLTYYSDLYDDRTALARERLNITKTSDDLKTAKQSIPTPAGNFQIAPRLALLGLAFTVLVTYFVFYGYVRKLRLIANKYNRAIGGTASDALQVPAPFWSPPNLEAEAGSSSPPVASPLSDVIPSVLLHVIWLSMAIWLVYECILKWKATKVLAFDYKIFWGYLLLSTLAAAALLAIQQYVPAQWRKKFSVAREPGAEPLINLSRRQFTGLAAVGVVGILAAGVVRYLRNRKGPKVRRPQLAEFTAQATDNDWIKNGRTGVIHYLPVCKAHLPVKHTPQQAKRPVRVGVHARLHARILATLGEEALKGRRELILVEHAAYSNQLFDHPSGLRQSQDELAITYYEKAIQVSPLSYHFYDKLRRVYGRQQKLYPKIQPMFEGGLAHVQHEIAEWSKRPSTPRIKKRLKYLGRMEEEFKSRIKQIASRKSDAEDYYRKKLETAERESKTKKTNAK